MSSVTFNTGVGGDGSTVTDDNNATTGLREGGWKTRFVPCFTQQVAVANYIVTKAGEASTSATAASTSATAAAASYDSFDDRYLGAKSSDPSVDNDGNALLTGAIYWNSTNSVMKVWSGSAWVSYNPAISYLPLAGGTMTGAITFAAGQFGTNVNTFLSTPSSANFAAALTDETGTGVNVFNNTPTLIAPLLGTPTSGNLTNCTNAIAYGLKSATTTVAVSSATAPTTGQVLTATSGSAATWQTPTVGGTIAATTAILKGNGSGGAIAATAGTDYAGISTANVFTANQRIGNVVIKSKTAYRIFIDDATYPSGGANPEQMICIGANIAPNVTSAGGVYSIGISPGNYIYNCLSALTTGSENIAIGAGTLNAVTTNSSNTAIGHQAYSTGDYTNSTCLGSTSAVTGSNQVQAGNSSTGFWCYGAVNNRSDIRDKTDIRNTVLGLDFIHKLRPVDFIWDYRDDYRLEMPLPVEIPSDATDEEKERIKLENKTTFDAWSESVKLKNLKHDGTHKRKRYHHGLIAQDIQAIIKDTGVDFGGFKDVSFEAEGDDVLGISYEELIAPLIKAVQELSTEFNEYKRTHP
jgi:hypothetical protein